MLRKVLLGLSLGGAAAAGLPLEPEANPFVTLMQHLDDPADPKNPLQYIKGTPEIIFAVASGKEVANIRAAGVHHSWCSGVASCVFFSDSGNPTGDPVVAPLSVQGMPSDADVYQLAQLRFLPILENMKILLEENKFGLFEKCKWIVITDDDTYVFYHNLKNTLAGLGWWKPIYTGNVIPDGMLPVHTDGSGKELGVSSSTPFVLGGGGSVFSAVAVRQMNVHQCVLNQRTGGKWEKWQSDWMLGQCAMDAGIPATTVTKGLFNQFLCVDGDNHVHFCVYGRAVDAELTEPCTLHPIKHPETMARLRKDYYYADTMPVRDVVVKAMASGKMSVLSKAEAKAYRAAKTKAAEAAAEAEQKERGHGLERGHHHESHETRTHGEDKLRGSVKEGNAKDTSERKAKAEHAKAEETR